jgi:hypothetical protein
MESFPADSKKCVKIDWFNGMMESIDLIRDVLIWARKSDNIFKFSN